MILYILDKVNINREAFTPSSVYLSNGKPGGLFLGGTSVLGVEE